MKLTKKDVEKICEIYDLGKVKNFKLIKHGLINYNYELVVDKGIFIIRVLGRKLESWKRKKLKLEFLILQHLKRERFPYKFPFPIKNKKGVIITNINKNDLWVYKKIDGEKIRSRQWRHVKEQIKALAFYDKYAEQLIVKSYDLENFEDERGWLLHKYKLMREVKPKNKTDKIMLKNITFFENLLKKVTKIKFDENPIVIHGDFHLGNCLFKKDKILGILDFDNVKYSPRVFDLAYAIRVICTKKRKLNKKLMNKVIEEYQKYNRLKKSELKMIIPFIILNNCIVFWWFYQGMKKRLDKRYGYLKQSIEETKNLVKDFKYN